MRTKQNPALLKSAQPDHSIRRVNSVVKSLGVPTAFGWGGLNRICPELQWQQIERGKKGRIFIERLNQALNAPQTDLCLACIKLRDLPSFCENGHLQPLNKVLEPKILKQYFPPILEFCKVSGELYAIPEDFTPFVILHPKNRNVRTPKTWQQLEKYSEQLSKKYQHPIIGIDGRTTTSILAFISALFVSNGVPLQEFERNPNDKERCFEAYRWIQKLAIDHDWMDDRWLQPQFRDVVYEQNSWTYEFGWLDKKKSLDFWKTNDFNPFPLGPSHHSTTFLIGGHVWVIPANSRHIELGTKCLQTITSLENILKMESHGGHFLHARQDVWKNRTILNHFPAYRLVKAKLPKNGLYIPASSNKLLRWLARSLSKSLVSRETPEQWFSRMPQTVPKDVHQIVSKTTSFMQEHVEENIKIDQLCQSFQVSRGHLDRLFQTHLKISASDYLKNLKMKHARKLLEETSLSIKEIAAKIGFSDRTVFSRAFHQHWGQSPISLRKRK